MESKCLFGVILYSKKMKTKQKKKKKSKTIGNQINITQEKEEEINRK